MSRAASIVLFGLLAALPGTPSVGQAADPQVFTVMPAPQYPARALAQGLEGRCKARFTIDEEGVPQGVDVSCTSPEFESAAILAVNRARLNPQRFKPGATIVLPMSFKLADVRSPEPEPQ